MYLFVFIYVLPCGAGELSVFCQSHFNKTLIGQAGSIGGKAKQEVGVEQRDWEYSGSRSSLSAIPVQTTEEATCKLTTEKGTELCANVDKDNGVIYVIRVNKKPDLMDQSVYNLMESCV